MVFPLFRPLTLVIVQVCALWLILTYPRQLHLSILKYGASLVHFGLISRSSYSSMDRISEVSTIIHILIDVLLRTSVLGLTAIFFNTYVGFFLIKIKQVLKRIKEGLPNRRLRLMWNSWWLIIISWPRILLNCCLHGVVLSHVEILTAHFVGVEEARAGVIKSV